MAKPSFKKQLEQLQTTPVAAAVGIPQMNPFDRRPEPSPVAADPVAEPVAPLAPLDVPPGTLDSPTPSVPAVPVAELPVTETAAPAERQLLTRTVDRGERLQQRGFHMYPQRHRQLLELAFIEERKPWQIIDDALQAYAEKRHRTVKQAPPHPK